MYVSYITIMRKGETRTKFIIIVFMRFIYPSIYLCIVCSSMRAELFNLVE